MGLLDKIKPHVPKVTPSDVAISPDGGLVVRWDDGTENQFGARWLRARCPCAGCVDEWSGQRTVGEAQVNPDVRANNLEPVGRYAVRIDWSDGHNSGIWSWEYLLEMRREQSAGTPEN
ncbi:MAG TPA: DUF971 domain-containing protein [Myxococcales bacterium]|nr:DUF971 domain-containing protein [Myxococcales bacterium]